METSREAAKNDRETNLLALQTSVQNRHVAMWGSVLGGILGAIFGAVAGGVVSYFRERKLEEERKNEEALKDLWHKTTEMKSEYLRLLRGGGDRSRIYDIATDMELSATKIADEDFKESVLKVLYRRYESPGHLAVALMALENTLHERAFPTLHEVSEEHPSHWVEAFMGDDLDQVPGPADEGFVFFDDWDQQINDEVELYEEMAEVKDPPAE